MHKKTILGGLALVSLGLVRALAQEPANGSPDELVMRESVDDYCAVFDNVDVDALLAYWANDADYVDEDGRLLSYLTQNALLTGK